MDSYYLASTVRQQLREDYGHRCITPYCCADSRFHNDLLLKMRGQYRGKCLVLGKTAVGGTISMEEIPSLTGAFSSLAAETARYQQMRIESEGVMLELNSFKQSTTALAAMFLLETGGCYVQKKKNSGELEGARCTRSMELLRSISGISSKAMQDAYDFIGSEIKEQVENGIVRALQIRYDKRHVPSLKRININVRTQIICPEYLLYFFANCMLGFLQRHIVNVRYLERHEKVREFSITLKESELIHRYDAETVHDMLNRCWHMDRSTANMPVVVVDGKEIEIKELNFFRICAMNVIN